MATNRLYRDMIGDTHKWNLYLGIDVDAIDVMAYSPYEDNSLFNATVPLDPAENDVCKAIESAVYDNPLLLNDFNKVAVISRNIYRAVIPDFVVGSDDSVTRDIAIELCGTPEGDSDPAMIVDRLPLLDCSMCHFMEQKLYNFLTRTFNGVKIVHRLSVLTRYFHGVNRGTGSFVSYVNLRPETFDMVMFNGNNLLLANTYEWTTAEDVLYYIIAVRRSFNVVDDKAVVLSGDREVREKLSRRLREFIPSVMPAVFPAAMFRSGGTVAMDTPTDLVVLPLCE